VTEFRADKLVGPSSRTALAPLQSCARFCLEPETFPIFLAWMKKNLTGTPPEWFVEDLIRRDIAQAHDTVAAMEELAAIRATGELR
jgi:hypothetical protein